jgi:hypothetical protein
MTIGKTTGLNKVSAMAIMGSVIAASFGVTTQANRERDFQNGNFNHFVIGGIVFTIFFVLLLMFIVKIVMHFSSL